MSSVLCSHKCKSTEAFKASIEELRIERRGSNLARRQNRTEKQVFHVDLWRHGGACAKALLIVAAFAAGLGSFLAGLLQFLLGDRRELDVLLLRLDGLVQCLERLVALENLVLYATPGTRSRRETKPRNTLA